MGGASRASKPKHRWLRRTPLVPHKRALKRGGRSQRDAEVPTGRWQPGDGPWQGMSVGKISSRVGRQGRIGWQCAVLKGRVAVYRERRVCSGAGNSDRGAGWGQGGARVERCSSERGGQAAMAVCSKNGGGHW